MAKQTEIGYEAPTEYKPYQTGGTLIRASELNAMNGGIADACNAVDELRTRRLPTYLVATGGDEATQDVYQEAILGPCLIVDLSTATTYYDNGEDGEGHERTKLTSGADIDDLRDSLSRTTGDTGWSTISDLVRWRVIGRVLYVQLLGTSYQPGETTLGTLPASARPSYNQDALSLAHVEGSTSPLYLGVHADGRVTVTNRGASAMYGWGIACLPM